MFQSVPPRLVMRRSFRGESNVSSNRLLPCLRSLSFGFSRGTPIFLRPLYLNRLAKRREIIFGGGEYANAVSISLTLVSDALRHIADSRADGSPGRVRPIDTSLSRTSGAGHASEMSRPITRIFFLSPSRSSGRGERVRHQHDRRRVRAARLSRTSAVPRRARRARAPRVTELRTQPGTVATESAGTRFPFRLGRESRRRVRRLAVDGEARTRCRCS